VVRDVHAFDGRFCADRPLEKRSCADTPLPHVTELHRLARGRGIDLGLERKKYFGIDRERHVLTLGAGVPTFSHRVQAGLGQLAECSQPGHSAVGIDIHFDICNRARVVKPKAMPGVGLQGSAFEKFTPFTICIGGIETHQTG
jgi:hypothetical protein